MPRFLPLLIGISILFAAFPAKADSVWLVIGASDPSAMGIASKAKTLVSQTPRSLIVQTDDCGDKKNVFAWVAEVATSVDAAQDALKRLQATVKDVYVKRCEPKPGTLLSLGISAIDNSIANVPDDSVNWQDEDRISSAQPLPDGRVFVIARYYAHASDDPLEGRRERAIIAKPPNTRLTLEENCVSPGRAAVDHGRIVFHCAREQAGDTLLHSTLVFGASGKKLMEIQHCREPKWLNERTVACDAESVGPDGKLKLHEKRIDLANGKHQVTPP